MAKYVATEQRDFMIDALREIKYLERMTQEDMAFAIDCSQSSVNRAMNKSQPVSTDTLIKYVEKLGYRVSIHVLDKNGKSILEDNSSED